MKLTFPALPANLGVRILLAVLTPVLVVGLAVLIVPRVTGLPGDAAFRVGDTVVTEDELSNRLDTLEALYGVRAPTDPATLDRFRRDSAKAVVVSMVLDDAARAKGIVIADKTARDGLTKFIEERFPEGRAGFVKLLGDVGASEQDVLEEIKRQQATGRLLEAVVSDSDRNTEIAPADVRKYYDDHKKRFFQPETRQLRNIVVASQDEAAGLIGQARGGGDFVQLAKDVSLDQSTRDSGGDLGFVAREQLAKEYADAAFGAPAGSFFGPVETQYGWNVGQVVEVRPGTQLQFEQVKDRLRDALRSEQSLNIWRDWLARSIKNADVKYADGYRPANPDAAPSATPSVPTQPGAGNAQSAVPGGTPR